MSDTGVTFIVVEPFTIIAPPKPVLPLSLIDAFRVIGPTIELLKSAVGVYFNAAAAIALLMVVSCPLNTRVVAVDPVVLIKAVVVQLRAPLPAGIVKVTVTEPVEASTSAKDMPVIVNAVSSNVVSGAGIVIVGASFTAVTLIVSVAVSATPPDTTV